MLNAKIVVIIPAFNEERSIAKVIGEIPREGVMEVVVISNGSTDNTEAEALAAGATVIKEDQRGYGYACLKGIDYARKLADQPDIIVFLDGDYSDYPEEMSRLVAPMLNDNKDMVIGSRALGNRQKNAMMPQQIFGNWLATTLLRWFYNARYTDLGPFRAIRFQKLLELNMQDKTYGWTVEMQAKACKHGLTYTEVPVNYRVRIGDSKVSGTVKGTILAGYKIISTIFRYL